MKHRNSKLRIPIFRQYHLSTQFRTRELVVLRQFNREITLANRRDPPRPTETRRNSATLNIIRSHRFVSICSEGE